MIDYKVIFANTDGANFPNTKAVNASGPATTDGTEFIKAMVDDMWGRFQALLDHAGLTPDGVTESPANSQHIEALQKGFIHPGSGVIWWQNDDPSVLGARVLLLNGQGILRANYTALDAAVYVGDGDNPTASKYYHADDAAGTIRNIAGIYLILPEMRGFALRGLDVAASVDPDGAGRDIGSVQDFKAQDHEHYHGYRPGGTPSRYGEAVGLPNVALQLDIDNGIGGVLTTQAAITSPMQDDGINTPLKAGDETRMINVATRFGITY